MFERTKAGQLHCLYSPVYDGNPYQKILYRSAPESGIKLVPLAAEDVGARLLAPVTEPRSSVFHQHWLTEIFREAGPCPDARTSVEKYFESLTRFRTAGGKVVWTVHNILEHDLSEQQRALNIFCLREMMRLADVVHIHTQSTLTALQDTTDAAVSGRVVQIKHPPYSGLVNLPDFLPLEARDAERPDGLRFLTFGMHKPYKGSADLVRAFLQLLRQGQLPGSSLVVAGSVLDPELRKLLKTAADARSSILVIDRRITDSELMSLCRRSDAVVLPYRRINVSGSFYLAATAGKPCIAPDVGMFTEEISDGIDGIKYRLTDGVAAGLLRAHQFGPSHLAEMGQTALQRSRANSDNLTSRAFARLFKDLVSQETTVKTHDERPPATLPLSQRTVLLSFCIPVMNRLADLKATLAQNLDDNAENRGKIEFVILSFDGDNEVEDWICATFGDALKDGYLRFFRSSALAFWHFGRAKNAFRTLIKGKIYASLDADNFTGFRGGQLIIDIFERHNYDCVFHQFHGNWGDGTCGRISLPRDDYDAIGYDDGFLPRQWDELDSLLSILVQRQRTYVCYRGNSVLDKSRPFSRFLKEHAFQPRVKELSPAVDSLYPESTAAVGRHQSDYVLKDPVLRYSSKFNHLCSFLKNSDRQDLKQRYVEELVRVQRDLIREVDADLLERWVLEPRTSIPPALSWTTVVALTCVKDESALVDWYNHYAALGVSRFLIIDDHSSRPVEQVLPFPDVNVWRPIVGQFLHAKTFWLEILLNKYCRGLWCLTVDADEFLSLPDFPGRYHSQSESKVRRLITVEEKTGNEYAPGFLVDLSPGDIAATANRLSHCSFLYNDCEPDSSYRRHNTVRWSYGDFGPWAFKLDLRYHINGTVDSLRKFPLLRFRRGMHLNQGFHDLIIDNSKRSTKELARADLLPLLHYKIWNLEDKILRDGISSFEPYHPQTRENLALLCSDLREKVQRGTAASTFEFLGFALFPTPKKKRLRVEFRWNKKPDDDAVVFRNAPLVFSGYRRDVSVSGLKVFGPSHNAVLIWLSKNTPFTLIERVDAEGAMLARPDAAGIRLEQAAS